MITLRNSAARAYPVVQSIAPPLLPANSDKDAGDILYGAKAIAVFLFGCDDRKATRRVFNLWSFYQHRKERAGFLKLKGALCLSKSQWRAFRG